MMQQCEICHTAFTWKQVSKSLWLAYKPIACKACGRLHKVQFLSRILASILLVGPLFAFSFLAYPASTYAFTFGCFVLFPAVALLLPYILRYRLA